MVAMEAKKTHDDGRLVLTLFVSGASPNSVRAINNLQRILELHARDNYKLSVVDVRQEKALAEKEQIIALPLLIKRHPLPERRLIGDMSDTNKVLNGLGIAID
jgi:circadian clock protein KaiB